jgi:hypothetical protein
MPAAPRRRRWLRSLLIAAPAVMLLVAGGGEFFLRQRYGLGSPVLMMSDPATEYRAVPNQHVVRLGNHVDYNAYSMRSVDFAAHKTDPRELRVLMIGDSVINGGNQTDQSRTASALLQQRMADALGVPVIVGNISAGSWGPQNELGYLEKFGTFDADRIIIVVSSHDAQDEIGPLPNDEHVTSKTYWFATGEAFDRAFPNVRDSAPVNDPLPTVGRAEPCLAAFDQMLTLAESATGKPAMVVFHYERNEVDAAVEAPGHVMLREVCARHGIEPILLRDAYRAARAAGHDPFRDYIHPNEFGQEAMADAIAPILNRALRVTAARLSPLK